MNRFDWGKKRKNWIVFFFFSLKGIPGRDGYSGLPGRKGESGEMVGADGLKGKYEYLNKLFYVLLWI